MVLASCFSIWPSVWPGFLAVLYYYAFLEIIFYFAVRRAAQSFQKLSKPAKYKECPLKLVGRILNIIDELPNSYTLRKFITGWFLKKHPFESITKNDYKKFLAWVMFAKFDHQLDQEEELKLFQAVDEVLKRIGIPEDDSSSSSSSSSEEEEKVDHVHFTLEAFHYVHRPLLIYIAIGVSCLFNDFAMQGLGLQRRSFGGVSYWHRPAKSLNVSENSTATSMVYFHGICSGWGVYLPLIMKTALNREFFLFNLEGIRIHGLHFDFLTKSQYSNAVARILERHQCKKVNLVGHSFGTITAGWFVNSFPQMVSHITLIDPVSLLLFNPEVAYNFLYRKPKSFMEWAIYLFASSEISIAYALRRNFWWYENVLFLEDIPSHIGVHVSLAGNDEVGNSLAMQEYAEVADRKRQRHIACLTNNDDGNGSNSSLNSAGNNSSDGDGVAATGAIPVRVAVTSPIAPIAPPAPTAPKRITVSWRAGQSHGQVCVCNHSLNQLSEQVLLEQGVSLSSSSSSLKQL